MRKQIWSVVLLMLLCPLVGRADVSLLLHEAVVGAVGEATSAGHISLYFSNLCAETPTMLRLCRPGEPGAVLSVYPNFGGTKNYGWLAVPLLPFLYGVETSEEIPLYVNGKIRTLFRQEMRRRYLQDIVPDAPDGGIPSGDWRALFNATFSKDIYGFTLKTTPEQDVAFLQKLAEIPNVNRFDTIYYNCADTTRDIVNLYFPGATYRDWLNDLTMTTPKAITRSYVRYGRKRPALLMHVTKYAQLPGPIWRSRDNRNFTEMAFWSRKYLIPEMIFKPALWPIFGLTYYATGFFDAHQQYKRYATPAIAEYNLAERQAKQSSASTAARPAGAASSINYLVAVEEGNGNASGLTKREAANKREAERVRVFGTPQQWATYQQDLKPLLQRAIAQGYFVDQREVKTFFKDLELQSEVMRDQNGALALKVRDYGTERTLGILRSNLLAAHSDPQLAYRLMLARMNASLNAKVKNREPIQQIAEDWQVLKQLEARCATLPAPNTQRAKSSQARFLEKPEQKTFSQRFKIALVHVLR